MKYKYWLLLLIGLISCGGGTSGSSPTSTFVPKTYEGTILDENGTPEAGARVESPYGNEQTVTDQSGAYRLEVRAPAEEDYVRVLSKDGKQITIIDPTLPDNQIFEIQDSFVDFNYKGVRVEASFTNGFCAGKYGSSHSSHGFGSPKPDIDAIVAEGVNQFNQFLGYAGDTLVRFGPTIEEGQCSLSFRLTQNGIPISDLEYQLRGGGNCDGSGPGKGGLDFINNHSTEILSGITGNTGDTIPVEIRQEEGNCGKVLVFPDVPGLDRVVAVFIDQSF